MQIPTAIALGFFDGVHLGHAALLRRPRALADAQGLRALALSFDVHPQTALGRPTPLLSTCAMREALLRYEFGMDAVDFLHFADLMRMPWRRFFEQILLGQYHARQLVCGYDYRFGAGGEGTAEKLAALCRERGIGCEIVPPVTLDGQVVSSTLIRGCIARGDVAEAARLLGRPYRLTGPVVHGSGLGRKLGAPTANLDAGELLLPGRGVYITLARVGQAAYPAVTNVGVRPTVGGGDLSVESWLSDFDGDLYDRELAVDFHEFLRPERHFDSVEALRTEIFHNAEQARAYFAARAESEESL